MVKMTGMTTCAAHKRERGFTYLGILLAIALLGIGLVGATEVWVTTARRHRMEQLEWIGVQFTQAIGSYYDASTGSVKIYPDTLQELLEDHRYLTLRRHLRVIYANPFTGKADWEIIRAADGRVRGIRASIPTDTGTTSREFVYLPPVM